MGDSSLFLTDDGYICTADNKNPRINFAPPPRAVGPVSPVTLAGTVNVIQVENQQFYKKVLVIATAATTGGGTLAVTFPVAFTVAPTIYASTVTGVFTVNTSSATGLTVTLTGATGSVIAEGY